MIEHIKQEILKFLESDEAQVLVLKGRWGVGKTYTWKQWLGEASDANKISCSQYAYVSLFGCNSLQEMKALTFSELLSTSSIDEGASLKTYSDNIQKIFKEKQWREAFGLFSGLTRLFRNLPGAKNFTMDMAQIGWMSLKNALICIDDLERHGEDLKIRDVLGLVSVLKEQKKCKIILILNDETLDGNDLEAYENYREKIVDVELHFDPDVNELIQLSFDEDDEFYDVITSVIRKLDIKNVRIIQKIKHYLDRVLPFIDPLSERYQNSTINSVILFVVLHFAKPNAWSNLQDVLEADTEKFGLVGWVDDEEKAKIHGVELAWAQRMSILRANYDWSGADEVDQILGAFIMQGYLNVEKLEEALSILSSESKESEAKDLARKLHHKVGDLLHGTMNDNLEELIKAMNEGVEHEVKLYCSINHLNQYVSILRGLKEDLAADQLIQRYIDLASKEESNRLDLNNANISFSGPLDKKLQTAIQATYDVERGKEIKKVLRNIDPREKLQEVVGKCKTQQVSSEDIELLSKLTQKDFRGFLQTTEIDRDTHAFIKLFLADIGHYQEVESEFYKVQSKIIKVVQALANESKMNKFRLKGHLDTIQVIKEEKQAA